MPCHPLQQVESIFVLSSLHQIYFLAFILICDNSMGYSLQLIREYKSWIQVVSYNQLTTFLQKLHSNQKAVAMLEIGPHAIWLVHNRNRFALPLLLSPLSGRSCLACAALAGLSRGKIRQLIELELLGYSQNLLC